MGLKSQKHLKYTVMIGKVFSKDIKNNKQSTKLIVHNTDTTSLTSS